ncbi:MAG: RnfABCDGE type electron transport complex subunit G [Elusimicrobia bacterium]|nr:RnfABCDGE type electron transport complex subunit G [Elusimicrobiota bacterium]
MDLKQLVKFGLLLMLVCSLAAAALAYTYAKTKPVIEQRKIETEKEAIQSVFPQAAEIKIVIKDKENFKVVFDQNQKELGVAMKAAPAGYGGPIEMLVGVTREGKVSAIKIMNQNETPGLGTKTTEPKFYEQFAGKQDQELALKKDGGAIEAITAATISSRAVAKGVQAAVDKVLKFYEGQKSNESKK